jgi:hypothetical protein
VRLHHTTTKLNANRIMRDGFRNASGDYGLATTILTGVWFASEPLGVNEGCADEPSLGAPVIVIELDEGQIHEYELIEEGKPYREWCVPAELANSVQRQVIYAE